MEFEKRQSGIVVQTDRAREAAEKIIPKPRVTDYGPEDFSDYYEKDCRIYNTRIGLSPKLSNPPSTRRARREILC